MAQALLRFDDHPADAAAGFEIGWDYAHHALVPPAEHLGAGSPVRHGFEAGKAAFGRRTLAASRFHRKWLQLRLHAWLRGRAFEEIQVTPTFLREIDVAHCPITGEALTHASGQPSDASVDRVCNDAGYAAGNLAVVSTRANTAKADLGWQQALAVVRHLEAVGTGARRDGLDAAEWSRLALLMSFATPLSHEQAAGLPLLLLPPNRLRVLNAVQALQVLLTLQFTRDGYARRIASLTALAPDADSREAMRLFMHTLLARRIAAGRLDDTRALRQAMHDIWADPLVNSRWQRFALRLGADDCERIVQLAQRRGLAGPGLRWLPHDAATDGWALERRGYVGAEPAERPPLPRHGVPRPRPERRRLGARMARGGAVLGLGA